LPPSSGLKIKPSSQHEANDCYMLFEGETSEPPTVMFEQIITEKICIFQLVGINNCMQITWRVALRV
jgi:hypothetical protein